MGADPIQLRAILDVRLKLDDRKPIRLGRQQSKKKKNQRFSIFWGMFVSFATGMIYVLPLLMVRDTISGLWLFYTMFLFLLSITLVTDFSTVLIDTRDKYILFPQPVNDRTLVLSRILHIFIYLFRIVLPMSLPGWIAMGLMLGWKAALFFPIPLLLLVFTALFLVMGIYLVMLRLASAEKFRELLSYFQIAFSIILFGVYYLVPRAMDAAAMKTFQVNRFSWAQFTPSYWLAALYSWIGVANGTATLPYLSVLAILLPAFCIWVTIKFLVPQFSARLGGLDAMEASENSKPSEVRKSAKSQFSSNLAQLLNKRSEAEAGFIMVWLQTARSRSFKMKVYPMFAYIPIYFVYLMLQNKEPIREVWEDLPNTGKHIILLYMCSIVMLQAFAFVCFSDQYKASWIYWATPIQEPGAIMAGSFKVIWIKFFLPFFGLVSAFVLFVWGRAAILDVILALVNVSLFAVTMAMLQYRRFPFSKLDQSNSKGSRFLRSLVGMLIPGALGFGHYIALDWPWLKLLFLVLSSILLWMVWDSYAHTSWAVVESDED